MLKKLLIPFFVISVAAVATNGCGSSSGGGGTAGKTGTAGAGGAGGGTAGTGTAGTGTAGSGTAGAGTDAGTAGAGTDAGTAGAGTDAGTAGAGTDAGTAGAGTDSGTDTSTDSGSDASTLPACTSGTATSAPLSPADFCANLIAKCGAVDSPAGAHPIPATYMTMAECMTTYTANTTTVKTCQSYHLCWGVEGVQNTTGADPATHCQHAWGAAVCM
jgi:hypothetical protein